MQKIVNGQLVAMSAEEIAARQAEEAAAAEATVPRVVSMFQARSALIAAGHFAAVDAAVAASGDPIAQTAWEYATEVRRDSALVQSMAAALGLTGAQIDDLFRAAAGITV